jgi:hypothetical protein
MNKIIFCLALLLGINVHAADKLFTIKCDNQLITANLEIIDVPTVDSGADPRLELTLPVAFKHNVSVDADMIGGNKSPESLQIATKTSDGTVVINSGKKSVSMTLKVNGNTARITCRLELAQ